jgi:hypothetical protein
MTKPSILTRLSQNDTELDSVEKLASDNQKEISTAEVSLGDVIKVTNTHIANKNDPHGSYADAVAWAKGFGLGTVAKDISNTDLNAQMTSGFFRGNSCVNIPPLASANPSKWFYFIVIGHDTSKWVQQIAFEYGTQKQYTRQLNNGSWTTWVETWTTANLQDEAIQRSRNQISSLTDISGYTTNGTYRVYSANGLHGSFPSGAYQYGTLVVFTNGNSTTQMYYAHNGGTYTRTKWNTSDWMPWKSIVYYGEWLMSDRLRGAADVDIVYVGNQSYGYFNTKNNAIRMQFDSNNYVSAHVNGVSFYHGGTGVGRFSQGDRPEHTFVQGQGSGLQLLGNNAGVQARTYDNAAYIPMYASGFTTNSRRDMKKNIIPFTEDATSLINSTIIYNYQYNNELNDELPHTGIILDEAPVWVVDPSGEGVDTYAMISLAWKAVQELSAKCEELETRLNAFA